MDKIQHSVKVVANDKLCPKYYRLCMEAPPILETIQPGQFIHIRAAEGFEPFFRRPFSVYRAKKYLEILYEILGPGTEQMAQRRKGEIMDILGPLGTPFTLPDKNKKQIVMIAGGIGIAPFLILSDVLKKRKDLELILIFGVRRKDYVYPMGVFKKNGCQILIATEDGSFGVKGRVTELFKKIKIDPKATYLYTCGPKAMMAAVQDFAQKYHLEGQAACEEVMACGLGACLGCSMKTTAGYKTVCYDGPVFDLQEIVFE